MSEKIFYSKILLFGEYSIIRGHKSLTLPYNLFSGQLKLSNKFESKESNKELKALCHYLKKTNFSEEYDFDIKSFEFDINHGLFFDSTIPQGHGVGSSGALCASVFHRYHNGEYQNTNLTNEKIKELQMILSNMESHFHGASSGLDPLMSYLNQPLLTNEDKSLEKISIPKEGKSKRAFFLLDTGRSRRTEPLVNLFIEKLKNPTFESIIDNQLSQSLNECIQCFINSDFDCLYKHLRNVSELQLEHFSPMIPKLYQGLWRQGLESNEYLLKLCGAGGGGFILGLTSNFDHFCSLYPQEQVRPLYRF